MNASFIMKRMKAVMIGVMMVCMSGFCYVQGSYNNEQLLADSYRLLGISIGLLVAAIVSLIYACKIGRDEDAGDFNYFMGYLDEIRLSYGVKSADWAKLSFEYFKVSKSLR